MNHQDAKREREFDSVTASQNPEVVKLDLVRSPPQATPLESSNDLQHEHLIARYEAKLTPNALYRRGRLRLLYLDQDFRLREMILTPRMMADLQRSVAEVLIQLGEESAS